MNAIQEIQKVRSMLLKADAVLTKLVEGMENPSVAVEMQPSSERYETVYPITVNPAIFKGTKPTAVMFYDERIDVSKWKKVAEEMMRRCNADSEKHVALMNLRGRISGRERVLLSKSGDDMRSPIKIDENLYIETHYDTETLLRTLMTRILDVVGYDYDGITVAIRNVVR